jgi:uncharacterized membrane protein
MGNSTTTLPITCPECSAQMPDNAAFCPGCGRPMLPASPAKGKIGFLPENVVAALAYFTFIPAIIFLTLDPYRRNVFVRLHAVQCLLLWVAGLVVGAALRLLTYVLFFIPIVGPLLVYLICAVAALAAFFLWLVLVAKALQGFAFKLPIIGDIAEHYAPWGSPR